MVNLGVFANIGVKTLLVFTGAVFKLFFAGGETEVCRRTTHVVDVAFKVGHPGHLLYLV